MKKATKTTQNVPKSSTTAPDVQPIRSVPPAKPQTAKEVVAANVQLLIEQLEAGKSDRLIDYMTAMARFRKYSLSNVMEIARQRPGSTRIARMYAWNQLGRRVKKGEKGIRILAPVIGVRRKKDANAAEQDIRTQNEPIVVGFRPVWVWDREQTTGADLPELESTIAGEVGTRRERLLDFIGRQGIALAFDDRIAPALGVCYGTKIVLLPGQSAAEEFTTLVHEISHALLPGASRRIATTKAVRETEAEAVAFVVGTAIGLDIGTNSSDYIALWHGNAELLAESLEVVQKTAAIIIAAIETNVIDPEQQESKSPASEPNGAARFEEEDILKKTA